MPTSAAAQGASGNTPKPVSKTTTTSSSSNLQARATFAYGTISVVSFSGGTLCLSLPVTVSNTGNGHLYDIEVHFNISQWGADSGKTTFAISPHSSRTYTWAPCIPGFTQPSDACYAAWVGLGGRYWGDPDPSLADLGSSTANTDSFCIPR